MEKLMYDLSFRIHKNPIDLKKESHHIHKPNYNLFGR